MPKNTKRSRVVYSRRPKPCGKFRSRFESIVAKQLTAKGKNFLYEKEKIAYTVPESNHKYTPDFRITKQDWYIEVKGRFDAADRKKHILIRDQGGPEIRFCFYNAHAKLRKGSPTSYAMWCDKNGFKWCHRTIPDEWLS